MAPMLVSAPWKSISSSASSKISGSASAPYGGFFEYDRKKERLEEVEPRAGRSRPSGATRTRAQELGRERARLAEQTSARSTAPPRASRDAAELLELAERESDEAAAARHRARRRAPRGRRAPASSSSACSAARWTRTTPSSTSRPAPAAPRRRTGRRCCCACTCAGPPRAASTPR